MYCKRNVCWVFQNASGSVRSEIVAPPELHPGSSSVQWSSWGGIIPISPNSAFSKRKKKTVRHDIRNVHTDINKICFKFLKPWRNIMPIFESRFQDGIIHWGSNHRPGKEQNPHVLRVPAKVDWWPTPNMATVYHPSSSNSCVLFFHIPLNHHFKGQQSNFWSSITWLGNSK